MIERWTAGTAISFVIGEADPADEALIETTERGLAAGIAQGRARRQAGRRVARGRRRRARCRVPVAGRSLFTVDGTRAAHVEHTVAVTAL